MKGGIIFAIQIDGKNVRGFRYNFRSLKNAEQFRKFIKEATNYLFALLETVLGEHIDSLRVGHLAVKVFYGDFSATVMDIYGIIPTNITEITEIASKISVSEKIRDIILDYVLSTKI